MAYREDKDLAFLQELDSKDLDALVYCLTHDSDGKLRYTEELTKREKYKQFHPEHNKYWDDIAGELQCFGGNTFATFFKGGKGVLYSEILNDVCEKCKVSTKGSIVEKEDRILMHILAQATGQMSQEDLNKLANELHNPNFVTAQGIIAAAQAIFALGGLGSNKLAFMISNAVYRSMLAKGIAMGGNFAFLKVAGGLMGPIGIALGAFDGLQGISSPAYRVTIPAVVQIAYLRKKYNYDKRCGLELEKAIDEELENINISDL